MRRSAAPGTLPEALAIAETVLPPSSTVGGSLRRCRALPAESTRWMTVAEELLARAEVVLDAERVEIRAVHEDDLRLDVHLRLAQVERLGEGDEVVEHADRRGDADAVRHLVGRDAAAAAAGRDALAPPMLLGPGAAPPAIVGCAGGAPGDGRLAGPARRALPPERSDGMHCIRRVRSCSPTGVARW